MKDFSLYERALKLAGRNAENLGDVHQISRKEFCERETMIFRARVPCLEYASLLIENGLLLRARRSGRVYAGFEKLSLMEPVVDRYMRIADVSERVHVFGEDDWTPPRHPNMRVTTVESNSPLAREWFVVVTSPAMNVALVGAAESRAGESATEERTFRAIKTHDQELVERLAAAAEDLVDAHAFPTRKAS